MKRRINKYKLITTTTTIITIICRIKHIFIFNFDFDFDFYCNSFVLNFASGFLERVIRFITMRLGHLTKATKLYSNFLKNGT